MLWERCLIGAIGMSPTSYSKSLLSDSSEICLTCRSLSGHRKFIIDKAVDGAVRTIGSHLLSSIFIDIDIPYRVRLC